METELAAAESLAHRIRQVAAKAHSEEDLRVGVEQALGATLQALGLTPSPEYEKTMLSGAADAVYGHVVIEYKRPGRLAEKDFVPKLTAQVSKYLADMAHGAGTPDKQAEALGKMVGVGLDGEQLLFMHYSATRRKGQSALPGSPAGFLPLEGFPGGFQVVGPVPVERQSVELLLLYLRSLARKPLAPAALAADFGPQGPLAPRLVNLFYSALQAHRDHPRVATLFDEWDRIFGIVYGEELDRAEQDAAKLAALYHIVPAGPAARPPRLKSLFFAVHTYYALLMKLLAVELASLQSGALVGSLVASLPTLSDRQLHQELANLENGGTFALLGINNFLEGDFFGWYLDAWTAEDPAQGSALADGLRAMAQALAEFEPATSTLEPEYTRDLLKKLYQYLVPRELRHDLGEYYTPDWLAERLLNQVGYHGEPDKRLIDPGCGSGTFPVLALRRLRQYAAEHFIPPADVLGAALRNIVGFDLNPLSVIAARTNYLLALGDLLRYRRGPVDLPVYMCDSILTPSERADIFGKSYHLHTVAGDFEIPGETVEAGEMGALSALLERCVRDGYLPEEFMARAQRELSMRQAMTATVLEGLYRTFLGLEEKNKDGLWARLIKNAFAPVLVGQFDYVVGNPPWVNWESLSAEYREATRRMWQDYGLFSLSGHAARLGGGKKDLAMLFAYAAIDHYLKNGGRLGFVITQTVFKTKGAGDGFRRFRLGDGEHLKVIAVDDMVELQPFEGASNWTAVVVLQKGVRTKYPVAYTLWHKQKGGRVQLESTLDEVVAATHRDNLKAQPVDAASPTSPWITARPAALKALEGMIGQAAYQARAGACTWADGIYWLRILNKRPDGLLVIENMHEAGKRELKKVQAVIEPDLVYPFIEWKSIDRFRAEPSHYILMVQDPAKRTGCDEAWLKLQLPNTYSYLKQFENVLRKRSGFVKYFDPQKDPFYSMYNISTYTFSPFRVVWKTMGSSIESAVVGLREDDFVGKKSPIHKNTVISVSLDNEIEAHYLCAVLNSSIVNFVAKCYSVKGGKSFGSANLLEYVRIPQFDPGNALHARLAGLSQQAHAAMAAGQTERVGEIEAQVDQAAAELWGLTEEELAEIQRSLEELRG